jgi:NAD(P)-dependent dehydrogenase (short-subunit alcohol dehydrogenase family)
LVNNLGITALKAFGDIADADWTNILEVNVLSGVRLSRHYLPLMMQQDWGRIIFISSESGINIPVEMIHYGVTKTAQLALSHGLAETTVGSSVTVNSVLPCPTRSEAASNFIAGLASAENISTDRFEQEFFMRMRPSSLIKRFAETAEVAALVAFVASPLAAVISGATF